MSELEQIEEQIAKLAPRDLAQLRAWFLEFDARVWDQQIEADSASGKLDKLIGEAVADYKAGKARDL